MNDKLFETVRLQRPSKIDTDESGRPVRKTPEEAANELELVSTMMLKSLLSSESEESKARMRELAEAKEGILARDTDNNQFEILSEDELRAALAATDSDLAARVKVPPADEPPPEPDEFSLVTTQHLRTIIVEEKEAVTKDLPPDEPMGFNPYNKS